MTVGVQLTAQDTVEQALELAARAGADGCVVLVDEAASANLRWANNTLTTNGVMHDVRATVIATVGAGEGTAAGVVSRSAVTDNALGDLVEAAVAAARDSDPAEDVQPLVEGGIGPGWDEEPGETSVQVFGSFAPALGEALARAGSENRWLYGYAEHQVATTYLGSSSGIRLRHEQPSGHVSVTAKSADLTRSAWVGSATRDFGDVDVTALDGELTRRLGWSQRQVEIPAGRYPTVLPPAAVADLATYMYWTMEARDAYEGRSAYAGPQSGTTRVGEQLTPHPVTFRSDPRHGGLECTPFVTAHASSGISSVFDNGLTLQGTDWIRGGRLENLLQTRFSAGLTGLAVSPYVGNYVLEVDGATGSVDDLVAGLGDGLLLTCLWYIRIVDPQTLLLTGLTRDGVYVVEGGEVTGVANNFRFNESPLDLLTRFTAAGATVPSFSREWGDDFPRTATPPLLVPDFNMSSVSQAS
jgi:predicted Zn-dependent protease